MVRYRITADMAGMGVTQLGPGHTVTNNLGTGVDWVIRVHGAAPNDMAFQMADNRVEIQGPTNGSQSIEAGDILEINSREKTITLHKADGQDFDWFEYGVRSEGEGSGHYCFERLPAGTWTVAGSEGLHFDLDLIEERSEPSWMVD